MKKILCIFEPFDIYQTAYVYENGNKLDVEKFHVDEANKILENLISTYDIKNIELRGSKQYSRGIWENFTKYAKSRYNNMTDNIEVKYI